MPSSRPLTPKEIEAGAHTATLTAERFYRCYLCGGPDVAAFHFEGDWLFEFHRKAAKQLEILESGELIF